MGLGRLGARLARYALTLDMKVIAWSPNLTEAKAEEAAARLVGKSDLMSGSDVISVHMVLSPRSRGLIGAEDIARMKQGAILINTSRGPLVDEAALVAAVQAGKIIAALDVYDKEPLPRTIRCELQTIPFLRLISAMGSLRRGAVSILRALRTRRPSWTANPFGLSTLPRSYDEPPGPSCRERLSARAREAIAG